MTILSLTDSFRREQARVAARTTARLAGVFPALNLSAIDASAPAWLQAAVPIVQRGHRESVDVAAEYYARFRNEGAGSGLITIVPDRLQVPAVATSLEVLGPMRAKHLLSQGERFEDVARAVFSASSGAATRHALSGARRTFERTARASGESQLLRRVAQPGACPICRFHAMRNTSRRISEGVPIPAAPQFHDHCKCSYALVPDDGALGEDYETFLAESREMYQVALGNLTEQDRPHTAKNVTREMHRLNYLAKTGRPFDV
ncbi:hypothetical protein GCM10011490_24160 [Pseudoclavibacter endophyticus]|uniref:Phage head morphogenesis domain-containing protein n=1 Tax=Pseudoclavibacter endophyticus TaxID=1778590 RepID=A0A6H9WNR4_9MICO|nr:hypothetical protein [Pseudoclavibacter endophyticus]KAB1648418.1 hypothetical protein F8O04_12090 [Pseudoclavibacter endophyticus]GGA72557.1 hypothetical protein GCM10011490_24160 [Pseudoclavibacter endophyticus]